MMESHTMANAGGNSMAKSLRSAFVIIAALAGVSAQAVAGGPAVFAEAGYIRGYQTPDSVIENSAISAGGGLSFGLGCQWSRFSLAGWYGKTGHIMKLADSDVGMTFSDLGVQLGYDITSGKRITPYVFGGIGFTRLVDAAGDGFKDGMAFGLGAGLRLLISRRFYAGTSLAYNANKYGVFEVTGEDWARRNDLRLNPWLFSIRLGAVLWQRK
jgi:hypothetical protein